MKKALTSIVSTALLIFAITVLCVSFGGGVQAGAASGKTGVGLAEHALKAYNTGWKYSYGASGQISGGTRASDCAGLIKSYLWWTNDSSNPNSGLCSVAGGANSMLNSATKNGTINYSNSSSLPRIHGLILYQSPGHVGVYIGNNTAIDNRDVGYNVKKESVFGRASSKWTRWFKLPQINYPTTGWATYNGQTFYYENGEYVVSTTKIIDGKAYSFGSNGVVSGSAPATAAQKTAAVVVQKSSTANDATAAATKAAVSKAAAAKAVASKAAADQASASSKAEASKAEAAKAASAEAAASSTAEADRQAAMLASSATVSSQSAAVSLTDEVIPQATAPALAETAQKPTNTDNGCAIIIAILALILSASVVFERKLNKILRKTKYIPARDMVFQRIYHRVKK